MAGSVSVSKVNADAPPVPSRVVAATAWGMENFADRTVSGSTVLRVYFWVPLPVSIRAAGGQWVPLGGDAASGVGASPTTVTAGTYGGAANGRYQSDLVSQWWCVVRESGTPDWVTLDAVSRYIR